MKSESKPKKKIFKTVLLCALGGLLLFAGAVFALALHAPEASKEVLPTVSIKELLGSKLKDSVQTGQIRLTGPEATRVIRQALDGSSVGGGAVQWGALEISVTQEAEVTACVPVKKWGVGLTVSAKARPSFQGGRLCARVTELSVGSLKIPVSWGMPFAKSLLPEFVEAEGDSLTMPKKLFGESLIGVGVPNGKIEFDLNATSFGVDMQTRELVLGVELDKEKLKNSVQGTVEGFIDGAADGVASAVNGLLDGILNKFG